MSEVTKVPCTQCGAEILPSTAESTGGICMACKKGIQSGGGLGTGSGETAAQGRLKSGLGLIFFGVLAYGLLYWLENSGVNRARMPAIVALIYALGGKNLVGGILVVLGLLMAGSSFFGDGDEGEDEQGFDS